MRSLVKSWGRPRTSNAPTGWNLVCLWHQRWRSDSAIPSNTTWAERRFDRERREQDRLGGGGASRGLGWAAARLGGGVGKTSEGQQNHESGGAWAYYGLRRTSGVCAQLSQSLYLL